MVKQLSFSVARHVSLTPTVAQPRWEPYPPDDSQAQLTRVMRRRLSDDLDTLIRRACLRGHTATAEELLDVLRNLIAWEKQYFPHGRRPVDAMVERLAAELAAAKRRQDVA